MEKWQKHEKMIENCKIHKSVKIPHSQLVNLYGCEIGENSFIAPFVEIQKGVKIGKNCRIQSHTFICEGVTLEDNIFIGHGVMFINDLFPKIGGKFILRETTVGKGASIGSNATILPVAISEDVLIGAGAVVTRNIFPKGSIAVGSPARIIKNDR